MLAAENSDFSVTGELLAETLVVDETGNVNGSDRLIWLKDQWTVGLKTLKTWHAGVASMLSCSCWGYADFASTFIYTVSIQCPLGCSFETFAHPNNTEYFSTSKTNLPMARRHFVCKLSWRSKVSVKFTSRYCINIYAFCSLFLQDIVKMFSRLTWSCILWFLFFLLLTINKILNRFSLAADFVRFCIPFGPVRTDIFICAVILVWKHLALLVEEAELPVRFLLRHLWDVKVLFTFS